VITKFGWKILSDFDCSKNVPWYSCFRGVFDTEYLSMNSQETVDDLISETIFLPLYTEFILGFESTAEIMLSEIEICCIFGNVDIEYREFSTSDG